MTTRTRQNPNPEPQTDPPLDIPPDVSAEREATLSQARSLWRGPEKIQWGCVLMDLLGESTLENLAVVLSGLRSVELSQQVAPFRSAISTARALLGDFMTKRAVETAVSAFAASTSESRSFDIESKTLSFASRSSYDSNISKARNILIGGLVPEPVSQGFAGTPADLIATTQRGHKLNFRLPALQSQPIGHHNVERRSNKQLVLSWADLEKQAADLDEEDRQRSRPPQQWVGRLADIRLQVTSGGGLGDSDILDLSGLKHCVGLPGSGKTTLIILICVLCARRDLKVTVFFTTIQMARSYLETLESYNVSAGLLMGRAEGTHARHAQDLAELIATQGNGGFGRSRPGIDLFAQSCPLPAFSASWPSPEDWDFGEAPCISITEPDSNIKKLCPAWSKCGRVRNQRNLVGAQVWLGHIISSDTSVPPQTSPIHLQYFELVARTMDLVIVDECDEAQNVLDGYGALTLTLAGDEENVAAELGRDTMLLMQNRVGTTDARIQHAEFSTQFTRFTLSFLREVKNLNARRPDLSNRYEDRLLTTSFLLNEILRSCDSGLRRSDGALSALSDLWDTAMYRSFFFRGIRSDKWTKAGVLAPSLNLNETKAEKAWRDLCDQLNIILGLPPASDPHEQVAEVVNILSTILGRGKNLDQQAMTLQARLLIATGFLIRSYQWMAKSARPLVHSGELPGNGSLVNSRCSFEMRHVIPRSIAGTYSTVRFRKDHSAREGISIDYLVMDSAPRLLLHRFQELGVPNVLITSATSWLEPSSKYHVGKTPDIVLSPKKPDLGVSRLYFKSKSDPITGRPLHVSGSGREREPNLLKIVSALAAPSATGRSDLERTIHSMRTENLKRPRKAALVVNSYDQVKLVVERIREVNPDLSARTRGVLREISGREYSEHRYVLRGQVEGVGSDPDVDVLVFPLAALGRAVNIVFTENDDDQGKSAIGSIFFLIRPHHAVGDTSLMLSILAKRTEQLDAEDFGHHGLSAVSRVVHQRRYEAFRQVSQLTTRPTNFSQLAPETRRAFAANLLVDILQMIGRGIRKGMPVEVYFVDAAWAPKSALGETEAANSSVLVEMQAVLRHCLNVQDPDERGIYEALYGQSWEAFREIDGLIPPNISHEGTPSEFFPSPASLEDALDGWDPYPTDSGLEDGPTWDPDEWDSEEEY